MTDAEPTGEDKQGDEGYGGDPAELDVEAVAAELMAAEGFVEERVQGALARFEGMFPPAVLEEFADDLRCYLLTHPVASEMLARVRPRTERSTSGEAAIAHVPGDDGLQTPKGQAG
jgi:hypothetical protein